MYDAFIDALVCEIKTRAEQIDSSTEFITIFFGGGTPSLLTPSHLERITKELFSRFRIASDVEFTLECNPGTVNDGKLLTYKSLGVNRLSFGVQSFHEADLKFLSRIHTVDDAVRLIESARRAGFENVNLDLMFSLPQQTNEQWLYNLERARELETTHVSCYSLTIEEGTPIAVMVKDKIVSVASEEDDAQKYELTMETLSRYGYHQYEVSNYALPGYECRHNLTYWRHEQYLGFGPSAHSYWGDERLWNVSSLKSYIDIITSRGDAIAGKETLSMEKLRSEYIFLRLRSEGIDLDEFTSRFSADFLNDNRERLEQFISTGLMTHSDGRLRLTQKGYLMCDEICAAVK